MLVETRNLHVWAPGLLSTGGIQTSSRHFLEALAGVIPAEAIRVLVKNDRPEAGFNYNGFHRLSVYGHWRPPLRTPRFAADCLRFALRERPRLIVSTHLNFGPVARAARELVGVPYILMAHGIDAWDLKSRSRINALRKADLVLAVSRYTRIRLVQDLGLDPLRVQVLPNTFSPERFSIAPKPARLLQKYGVNSETPVILTVCRLAGAERYKGYDQMIEAMPRILSEVPDARYLLVGSGPDRSRIENLISRVGVQRSVTLTGFVPDEELADYYNLCDLFAMPSKAEGFGIVYLEALACGKPVLAGNKDASPDTLDNGELGLLVDPDDADEIAAETIRVLRRQHPHPNLFRPEFLRQRVTELFGFEKFKSTVAERLKPFLQDDGRQPTADGG